MVSHTTIDSLKRKYLHNVQVYLEAPEGDINVFEFEQLALKRIRLLKLLHTTDTQECHKYSIEWTKSLLSKLHTAYPDTFYRLCEEETELGNLQEKLQAREMDYISHFILRMLYTFNTELQSWFIDQEIVWLFLRFQQQNTEGRQLFFKLNHLDYEQVNDDEKQKVCGSLTNYSVDEIYYKVHFKEALNLIKERKVRLRKGFAYVPNSIIVYCIMNRFKSFLWKVISSAKQSMTFLDENYIFIIEQMSKTLNNEHSTINIVHTNNIESTSDVKIKLSDLNKYARKSFPLCMKNLHDTLKENYHLKYGSRYQLGNFLKTIGLSLEDSLEFWKTEFTHKITETTFEKNYAYFFKHMYGKAGSMRPYRPSTCQDIICENIGIEDAHGCPFKAWDSLHLTRRLQQCGIFPTGIDDIENEARNQQYEQACAKHFQLVHNQLNPPVINTPFDYFKESLAVLKQAPPKDISSDEEDIDI